jgi:putative superfamily III holin-X
MMAVVRRLDEPSHSQDTDGLVGALARLARLEVELGYAETRRVLVSALGAVAVALVGAIALIASIPVLLAGAVAPLFTLRWEPLITGGGAVFILSAAALAWSAYRLRALTWPKEFLASVQENWRWLGAQLRSRLTLR